MIDWSDMSGLLDIGDMYLSDQNDVIDRSDLKGLIGICDMP